MKGKGSSALPSSLLSTALLEPGLLVALGVPVLVVAAVLAEVAVSMVGFVVLLPLAPMPCPSSRRPAAAARSNRVEAAMVASGPLLYSASSMVLPWGPLQLMPRPSSCDQ